MPNKTIYIKDSDLKVWDEAQRELGESISAAFVDYLKERLATQAKRKNLKRHDEIQAMNIVLAEINTASDLDLELHPFWPPIIHAANTDKIGYKLHQRQANPDRIMSLLVHPSDFDNAGLLDTSTKSRIKAAVEKFWDGKRTDQHVLVDTTI